MKAAAARHCGGKLLFFHEGGYSAYYVPFCGLAVVEELAGVTTKVVDPELEEHCKVSREQGCVCCLCVGCNCGSSLLVGHCGRGRHFYM
jgi:hypothetical protein